VKAPDSKNWEMYRKRLVVGKISKEQTISFLEKRTLFLGQTYCRKGNGKSIGA